MSKLALLLQGGAAMKSATPQSVLKPDGAFVHEQSTDPIRDPERDAIERIRSAAVQMKILHFFPEEKKTTRCLTLKYEV